MNGTQLTLGLVGAFALAGAVSRRGSRSVRRRARTATLFSGGGMVEAGLKGLIEPVFAVEIEPKIARVYRQAYGPHVFVGDVRHAVLPRKGTVDYLHASPVCKNYSSAKRKTVCEFGDCDLDMETAAAAANALATLTPDVFTLENVKAYRGSSALALIEDMLNDLGYDYDKHVYNAADYGTASFRERLLLRAVRNGKLPHPPKPTHGPKAGQPYADWFKAVQDEVEGYPDTNLPAWMVERLQAEGVPVVNTTTHRVERPLIVMGGSGFKGKIPFAYAGGPAPTFKATVGEGLYHRILLPGGKIKRLPPHGIAKILGMPSDYPLPAGGSLVPLDAAKISVTILGNGVPPALSRAVFGPLLSKR
jgi:DNA (cytosine-5)-methyltransferase 1